MEIDPRRYTTGIFQELERTRLWPHVWLLGAHISELPEPGSFSTLEVGAETFLLSRGVSGVRAFHNVCLHRGTQLCEERRGHRDVFRCPYHGWRYDSTGRLLGGPGAEELVARGSTLREIECEERAGFFWIRASSSGAALDDFLGPLGERLAALELGSMSLRADRSYRLACNWKLSADIHNEALHLPALHPELCEVVDLAGIRWKPLGLHAQFTIPLGVPSQGALAGKIAPNLARLLSQLGVDDRELAAFAVVDPERVREAVRVAVRKRAANAGVSLGSMDPADKHQLYLFPNVQLNVTGLDLELYRHRPHITDPLQCVFDEQRFERGPARATTEPIRHEWLNPGDVDPRSALGQDLSIAPRVQRGLLSSGLTALRTGPFEEAISHMHAGISKFIED